MPTLLRGHAYEHSRNQDDELAGRPAFYSELGILPAAEMEQPQAATPTGTMDTVGRCQIGWPP